MVMNSAENYPLTFSSLTYLVFFLQCFVLSFLFNHPLYLFILLGLLLLFVSLSHHSKEALIYIRFSLFLTLFIALINIVFVSDGATVYYQYTGKWEFFRFFALQLERITATIVAI